MNLVSIATASLLAALSSATPLVPMDGQLMESRQEPGSYYAITGATGGVHPRLEIREMEKSSDMWNLFLLTIADFQAMEQDVIDSWYQIAGIHGMPWMPWDGVDGGGNMGYCPHSNLLFGIWHRPYLALFEQKMQSIAKSIANEFPTSSRSSYQDAATKLRIPYWDWAKALPTDQPVVPTSMSDETAQVTFPNGTAATIDNPLYDYNFHPLDNTQINGTGCPNFAGSGGVPTVCQNSQMTVRAAYPESDHARLNSKYRGILSNQRSKLYEALSQRQTFSQMTTSDLCGGPSGVENIESIHNPIHLQNYPGHMSPTGATAFDPMFWFHHANVDRQIALWQAVFPETYMEPCEANTPTYTYPEGEILDKDYPLTPFHRNTEGDFWTSALARNIVDFGYTYPELVGNPSNASIVNSIKEQYSGPSDVSVSSTQSKTKRQDSAPEVEEVYIAQIQMPTYGLEDGNGGSSPYNLLVFLGDVGSEVEDWITSSSFVGIASSLGSTSVQNDQMSSSNINLSEALGKAISSGETSEQAAADYLMKNLHWRLSLGDSEIPKEKLNGKGLEVSLVSRKLQVAQNEDEFDTWIGEFESHGVIEA